MLEQQNGGSRLQMPENGVVYSVFHEKGGTLPPEREERAVYTPAEATTRRIYVVGQVLNVMEEFQEFAKNDAKRDDTKVHSAIQVSLEADAPKKKHPRPGPRPKRKEASESVASS